MPNAPKTMNPEPTPIPIPLTKLTRAELILNTAET